MGNQPGTNPYQGYQPQGSQIAQQTFPYGGFPTSGGFQGTTPSVISNYYQQGYPPNKWPSTTNINTSGSQQSIQSSSNLPGSLVQDQNFIRGSQTGQIRGSQLGSNIQGMNYGINPAYGVQYADQINLNPSAINPGGNFNNKQRVSNI